MGDDFSWWCMGKFLAGAGGGGGATIDNSNFNHKNKVGKLKFNDINNLINSIKGNTISEADAKKN